jgi:hypothetical protein
VICEWTSADESVYLDSNSPYECDITQLAKQYANSYLCLTLDMVHDTSSNSREPVRFYSKEYRGEASAHPNFVNDENDDYVNENNNNNNNQFMTSKSRHEREQWLEGGEYWRSDAKTLKASSDMNMGNSRILGGERQSAWFGESSSLYSPSNHHSVNDIVNLPGLEFGTVRRYQGGASPNTASSSYKYGGGRTGGPHYGSSRPGGGLYDGGRLDRGGGGRGALNRDRRDAGATRRPHLLIEGSKCGSFPDYSARDCSH